MNSHVQKHFANAERAARLQCNRAPQSPFAAFRRLALMRLRGMNVYTGGFTS
jgi:hypothetical protein